MALAVSINSVRYLGNTWSIARRLLVLEVESTRYVVTAFTDVSIPIISTSPAVVNATYTSLVGKLQSSVASGEYTQVLQKVSVAIGAEITANASAQSVGVTSATVNEYIGTKSSSDDNTLSTVQIIIIAVGSFIGLGVIVMIGYLICVRRTRRKVAYYYEVEKDLGKTINL